MIYSYIFGKVKSTCRIFSIKLRVPNKRRVYGAEFKINAPDVYSRSRRLFGVPAFFRRLGLYLRSQGLLEMGVLNILNIWIYPLIIKPKLPFTIILLTKTDETNDVSGIVTISFKW